MNLIDIQKDDGWFYLIIQFNLNYFLKKFGEIGISGWYRLVSNSQHSFLGLSNRDFFKSHFTEGFYRHSIYNDEVNIVMFLKSTETDNIERTIKELIIRIKKLLFARIKVGYMNEIPNEDQILLTSKNGIRHYQKILETYSK
jgi:hypothetical protein